MNQIRLILLVLLTASLWIDPSFADETQNNSRQDDYRVSLFSNLLQSNGFAVKTGATKKATPLQWTDDRIIDSAAGNNAGQYYKVFNIPLLPGDPETAEEINLAFFMIKENEAIVWVGPTPPACDYFSFCPYLMVRHKDSLVPKGDWLFAACGDPLNNALIQTETGDPFATNTMVIFTADKGTYENISTIAQQAGYGVNMINRYVIPSSVLNLGISAQSDSFTILLRTANFHDQNAGNEFLNNSSCATIFRVTPGSTVPQPYDWPNPRNRETGPEGGVFHSMLQAGLERLKTAIIAKTPHSKSQAYDNSARWFYDSRDVLPDNPGSPAYRKFVAGEGSDTPYLRTSLNGVDPENFKLGSNDMVVVYGVNHAATGLATYSNFGIYGEWITNIDNSPSYIIGSNDPIWNGVIGMNSHDFTGSADYYIPGDPMAPFLYAVRVVRGLVPQKDVHCISVPQPSQTWWVAPDILGGTADGIAYGQQMLVGYRSYLNSTTNSGPAYDDIIPDRAIWFHKPDVQGALDLLLQAN